MNIINVYFLSDIAVKLMYERRLREESQIFEFAAEMMFDKQYTNVASCELASSGRDAADEMFDISNNPSEGEAWQKIFGNKRSLSVGDIVQVNDQRFVCAPVGWVDV